MIKTFLYNFFGQRQEKMEFVRITAWLLTLKEAPTKQLGGNDVEVADFRRGSGS